MDCSTSSFAAFSSYDPGVSLNTWWEPLAWNRPWVTFGELILELPQDVFTFRNHFTLCVLFEVDNDANGVGFIG